jgi:WD40 repeat protein
LASSPRGGDVLSGGVDEVVRVLSGTSGREKHRFSGHRGEVVRCEFTADGKFVLSASADGTVKIWDRNSGRCCRTVAQHEEELTALAVSSDGSKMLIGDAKGSVRLWNVDTGWFTRNFLEPAICRPRTFQELVGLHASFTLAVEDFNRAWRRGDHDGALGAFERMRGVPGFSWSREAILGRNIVSESSRRGELSSSSFIRSFYGHTDGIADLAPGPDCLTLFSGSLDGTAAVWDVVTGRCMTRIEVGSPVRRVLVLPRMKGFLTWSEDGVLATWDASGRRIGSFPDVRPPVVVSDDGSEISAMSPDNKLLGINLDRGDRVSKGLTIPSDNFISFADALRTVYSLHDRTKIQRWSLADARVVVTFRDLGLKITSLLPSASDERVVAGTETGQIIIYLTKSGFNVADLRGHRGAVLALASTPEGDLWASGSDDFFIRLWDLNASRCIMTLEGHSAPVTSVKIFPNASLVASGASDGSLRLWGLEWQFLRP